MIGWLIDSLIDWLIDWLIGGLIDRLVDWYIDDAVQMVQAWMRCVSPRPTRMLADFSAQRNELYIGLAMREFRDYSIILDDRPTNIAGPYPSWCENLAGDTFTCLLPVCTTEWKGRLDNDYKTWLTGSPFGSDTHTDPKYLNKWLAWKFFVLTKMLGFAWGWIQTGLRSWLQLTVNC